LNSRKQHEFLTSLFDLFDKYDAKIIDYNRGNMMCIMIGSDEAIIVKSAVIKADDIKDKLVKL